MFDEIPGWVWWVAVIFVAGVVGQFGKSLTLKILGLFSNDVKEPEVEAGESEAALDLKQQKKLSKAEVKRAKKEAKSQAKHK